MLKREIDFPQVVLGLAGAVWPLMAALLISLNEVSFLPSILIWALVWLLVFRNNYILHNHIHVPFFRSKPINRAFSTVLGLSTGMPAANWILMHVHGHHVEHKIENLPGRKWLRRFIVPQNEPASAGGASKYVLENFFHQVVSPVLILWGYLLTSSFRRRFAIRYLADYLAIIVYIGVVTIVSPLSGVFLLSLYVAVTLTSMAVDYISHVGDFVEDEIPFSNACRNPIYNRLFWNFGYHVGHHMSPRTHWRDLPKFESGENVVPTERRKAQDGKGLVFRTLLPMSPTWTTSKFNEHFVRGENNGSLEQE